MKLPTLGGLVFMVLGLPLALGQGTPFPQGGSSCPLLGDEVVKPLNDQCLDPGNGGSAVCGSYNCFISCDTVTVNDCFWAFVCASFGAACVYWTTDPRGKHFCAVTYFLCQVLTAQRGCTPLREQRCQVYCVR